MKNWAEKSDRKRDGVLHMIGTADATGITESSDMALDRALSVKINWIKDGWKEEHIKLSTGQRNLPNTLQNRCVLIYFE
jgi:hypothetical protein